MATWIKVLSFLLVIQVGLIAWFRSRSDDLSAYNSRQPLLSLDISGVDRVAIEEKEKKPLVMTRQNGGWVLPAAQRFPVSPTRFREFTEKLLGSKPSWPVGRTKVAAKQLKVSDDTYERKIRFFKDGEAVGVVFLGSSPAFRKVHARLEGDDTIYSLNFNVYEARTNPADWYDRSLLNLSREEVALIDMGAYAVKQDTEGFIVEGLAQDEKTDVEGMRKLVSGITSIGFEDVLGKDGAHRSAARRIWALSPGYLITSIFRPNRIPPSRRSSPRVRGRAPLPSTGDAFSRAPSTPREVSSSATPRAIPPPWKAMLSGAIS